MDGNDNSSSCSVIEIDGEEEEMTSCLNMEKIKTRKKKKKRKRISSSKEDEVILYSADSSDDQSNNDIFRQKKYRKKFKEENSKINNNNLKGDSGKIIEGSNIDTGDFGFESEAIFSQFVGDKNESTSISSRVDSSETVQISDADTETEGESYPQVPSLHLDIADEEMEADTGLRKPTTPDIENLTKSLRKVQQKTWTDVRLSKEIEDKEFWSDQDLTSSDDDTPLLQLNPMNITQTKNQSGILSNEITTNFKISPAITTDIHSQKQSDVFDADYKLNKHMCGKSTEVKHIPKSGLGTIDNTESEDETQPFDEYELPDLSPPHQEEQSTHLPAERENSPEIFKDVEDPGDQENLYTQVDDCIYIEDSEEEELSQSLFQQEVKLELDDSSDEGVYDGEEESWREILSLDESDEDTDVTSKEMSKLEQTSGSLHKMATNCGVDPYASSTQVNTDDLYTSSTQILSKDSVIKNETQTETSDPYSTTTQIIEHNLCSSDSEDDAVYNTATQIGIDKKKLNKNDRYSKARQSVSEASDSNSDVSLFGDRDPYSSATQVVSHKHCVTSRKDVNTDRNSKNSHQQEKMDHYMCATQHDSNSYLTETQVDQADMYLEATQVEGGPEMAKKKSSSTDDFDNNERDLYFEPTQNERTGWDPYDVATQVDSQHDGNYGADTENMCDSEYDDIILLSETESVTSTEPPEKESVTCMKMDVSEENQLSKNQDMVGKVKSGNSNSILELAAETGSACDEKSEQGRIPEKKDSELKGQMSREGEERNVFQDLYKLGTQIDDSTKNVQNIDTASSESWSDMELYECATQIDSLSGPQEPVLFQAKSAEALEEMDQSNATCCPPSTSAGSSNGILLSAESAASSSDEFKSLDVSSSDLEIESDSADRRKTWVNAQNYKEKQQRNTALSSRESEFLSIKMKSFDDGMSTKNIHRPDIGQSCDPPPILKQVAPPSSIKPAILIPPQPQKSTKEKREQFKINNFYSKKSPNQEKSANSKTAGHSVQAEPNTSTKWLSKTLAKSNDKKRPLKTTGRGGSHAKKQKADTTSNLNLDALIHAKAAMFARKWVKPFLPEPVKKPSIDTKSNFTDDVRMPELDEVMKKQLPLMDDGHLFQKTNEVEDLSDKFVNDGLKQSGFAETEPSTQSRDSSASSNFQKDVLKESSKPDSLKGSNIPRKAKEVSTHKKSSSTDSQGLKDSVHREKDSHKISSSNVSKSGVNVHLHKDSSSEHKLNTTVLKDKNSSRKSDGRDKSSSRGSSPKENPRGVSSEKGSSTSRSRSRSKEKDETIVSSAMKETNLREINLSVKKTHSTKYKEKSHFQSSVLKDKGGKANDDHKDGHKRSGSHHHSRTSSSKDKGHSKKSSSKVDGSSKVSCPKDKDNLRRSSSREKEHSNRFSSKKDDSRKSTSRSRDDSSKMNSNDDDKSRKSSSRDSDKTRKSSSRDSDTARKSSSRDSDTARKSSSKDSDKSKSNSKEKLKKFHSKQDEIFKSSLDKNCSRDLSRLENSSFRLSWEDRDNLEKQTANGKSLDVSGSAESVSKMDAVRDMILNKTGGEKSLSTTMESLTSLGQVNVSNEALENCDLIPPDAEEDMEDVKLGKLAKAAAIEKNLPSSQDQMEDDDYHIIIIDDEETMEDKMKSKEAEGKMKDATAIKSILKKDYYPFFADRNDESRRRGQKIKFKLAPDRVSERTQRYINSLLQKNKNGGRAAQGKVPTATDCLPSMDAKSSKTVAKPQTPNRENSKAPPKMTAMSSMHSSCVTVTGGEGQSRGVGGSGMQRTCSGIEEDYCSQFFNCLLKWRTLWFSEADKVRVKHEQRKCYEPPPVSGNVYPIPERFNSYKDYVNIFIPHLLQEAWEQSYQSWRQLKSLKAYPQIGVVYSSVERNSTSASSDLTFEKYTWYGVTTKKAYDAFRKQDHLGEKFLVIMKDYGHFVKSKERLMDKRFYQPDYFDQIGFIEKIQLHSRPGSLEQTINTFKVLGTDPAARQKDAVILCITVLSKRRPLFKHLFDKLSYIQPVASLVTIVRQFQAVSSLPRSPVYQHILLPGQPDVFYEKVTITDSMKQSLSRFNESQRLAICAASQMILGNPNSPKIGLLHGPPGTGKSSTVVAIVEKVLTSLGSNVRICLCAPSNNAVDLLIKRLDYHKKKTDNNGLSSALSIVRIGNAEAIHKDVKKFSLSEILLKESFKMRTEKKKENIPRSVLENYNDLKERLETLKEQRRQCQGQGRREESIRLSAEIEKIEKRVADMEKDHFKQISDVSLSRADENNLKRAILHRATIVCGTLSAFGQPFISDLLRQSAKRGRPVFDCIIVDEASQANELDCIIPLQYQVNKLILVGDPEQLPPTITSQKAAQNYFGQSLFERFYRHFQSCKTAVSPVLMLDTQYRMHPDIAYWPSEYIYQGKLKTDESVINRCRQRGKLKPFLLFDVQDSQETLSQTSGDSTWRFSCDRSVSNPTEVEFIVQLVLVILETAVRPQEVGIIAPYKNQKHLLISSLARKGVKDIEISTVDGFQGQEKEVIVFSCVRAKNQSRSIGFMADKKRMNVALTRAKSALYIVAHLDSLRKGDVNWRNMIEDANRRHLIRTVPSGREFSRAVKQILI